MSDATDKSPAEIEREIDRDRQRIGEKLTAIQDRLTPGQMVDEAMAYMKSSGGGEFVANLGSSLKTNPLPVALLGVSVAWLMAGSGKTSTDNSGSSYGGYAGSSGREDFPFATVTGDIRREGPARHENGSSYSHFVDSTGKRYRALTNEAGHRAGHFMDDAGKTYRGFADAAGNQVRQIRDETGALLDDATGWASSTWSDVKDAASRATSSLGSSFSSATRSMRDGSSNAMSGLQDQTGRINDMLTAGFRDQPLVGGALAFALGAALGAALPNTRKEDELLGEKAAEMRSEMSKQASDLIDKGEKMAGDAMKTAASVASDVHDAVKDRIGEEAGKVADAAESATAGVSTTKTDTTGSTGTTSPGGSTYTGGSPSTGGPRT